MMFLPPALLAALAIGLAGCTSYIASPLPEKTSFDASVSALHVFAGQMPISSMRSHRFDPGDGLDMTEVAMLAVANNPELKALRADAGVSRAQAFAAGLLPDPQIAIGRDQVIGSPPGSTVALSLGLTVDVAALLARSSARASADADIRKTDLNLLWQEWQTVAKARLLFVKTNALATSLRLLDERRTELNARYERTRTAVEHRLITSDAATPQLAALQDVERQRNDLERQANQTRHDLNALLGVDPALELTLVGPADLALPDAQSVGAALASAPQHRPDLLALQAGYASQDERYRGALRAQFPAITVGPTRARDTSDVNTIGFSLGITLPLFNRNRGNIAIELATREKLRLDYQQRLDATANDAHRLLAEEAILERQRLDVDASIDQLAAAARRAQAAFTAHGIDALTLTNVEATLLTKRLERVSIEQALREQAIALQALIGETLEMNLQPRSSS